MAEERDPEAGAPSAAALEQRVARLESALAALEQRLAAPGAVRAAPPPPVPAAWAAPLPPPPPPRAPRHDAASSAPLRPSSRSAPLFAAAAAKAEESSASLESRLGSQIFNRIAIVALLFGTAYGLKLAVDRGWLGPIARVAVGLVAGAGLVLWSERFRAKGFAAFSYSLKALGSGVLYLSLWAAFRLFHLLPAPAALCLMILVTAWNAFMAWAQDSELLAAYALAGGFATPMLLATGGNHETFLFTYLLAIDLATVVLVRLRGWPRLLLGAFPLTVAYFAGWYVEFYSPDALIPTCAFLALFAAVFASVPLGPRAADSATVASRALRRSTLLEDILLPLANVTFTALMLYSALKDADQKNLMPWLMVALAAIYLALMRARQTRTASAIHLSLAVVLLTIAIPLKASGHWITVSWLVEGLALLWVATRLGEDEAGAYSMRTLRWLSMGSLLLGLCGVAFHIVGESFGATPPFLNKDTGTALTGIAVFACAAWLALRAAAKTGSGAWPRIARETFGLIPAIAVMLSFREIFSWDEWQPHSAFQNADFATALVALAVLACVVAISLRIARERPGEAFWASSAAGVTIGFNLIAVLTGVREVGAIWTGAPAGPDAALQQALAISAFLMLYGAALLAAGFWRRSGFLRWQALALLVFTIFKTFLYDMRDLSQGYRVVSFLGLGALLMAISFAYQKDWLNLRGAEELAGPAPVDADPGDTAAGGAVADADVAPDPGAAQ